MFSPYLSKINKQDKKERLIFNLSILGILLFLALAVTLPFRDQLLNFLFPKPPAQAVETWVEVGTHPEASIETTTAAKELRTLAVWNGKIYAGYGDYGVNTGPMFVSPFDPVTKTFTQVHKACTEAAYLIRVIGDRLYIPATDRHSATCGFPGADYTVGKEDGTWEDRFVVTSEHMFEMLTFSGTDIWMVGANGNNAAAWRSLDNGATWQRMLLVPPVSGISGDFARFYFAGVLNGKLYMQAKDFNGPAHPTSKVFDGTNWSDGPSLLPAWAYGGNTTPFLGKLFYRGYHDFASSLFQFDGITYSPVPHPENGGDFIVYQMDIYNNEFYVLSNQPNSTFLAIYKTTNLANWTKVASTVPINARSFALLNGKYYIGTSDSKIYEYDPSPLPPTQANPLITPDYFPFGVFEDGNLLGTPQNFTATLTDLKAHNLDSIMLVNTRAAWANEYLPLSDTQNVNVLWYLSELNNSWWPDTVPDTIEKAREVVQPLVDQVNGSTHPSFKGYFVKDEPGLHETNKVRLATQAIRERDPNHMAFPLQVGINRVEPALPHINPDIMTIDAYPIGTDAQCDYTMTGFGYGTYDFSSYIREVTDTKPVDKPLWVVLQTHNVGPPNQAYSLRQPIPAEVRAQHWMAIGEGAKGIFWFVYSSQQGWTGLKDNPTLFNEISTLSARTKPLAPTLLTLHRAPDKFSVTGSNSPYISTLMSKDNSKLYAVVDNKSCSDVSDIRIAASGLTGQLRNLETGQTTNLGDPIPLKSGDGTIYELINSNYAAPQSVPVGTGNGVTTTYYDNTDFTGTSRTRNDTFMFYSDFLEWIQGFTPNPLYFPFPPVGTDDFSGTWQADLEAPYTGAYTFTLDAFDGGKLTINNQDIIPMGIGNNRKATINLTAGQKYPLKVSFVDKVDHNNITLYWESPYFTKTLIPASQLYTTAIPLTPLPPTATPTTGPSGAPTPTPTPSGGSQTITFDDRPAGALTDEYPTGVMNWGTGVWTVSSPWQQFTTNSIYFTGGTQTSGSFSFITARRLVSLQAFNGGGTATTVTLSCSGQPDKQVSVPAATVTTIATGWSGTCSPVTIGSTNGQDTNFDNFVIDGGGLGGPPAPTNTPTPIPPTATPTGGGGPPTATPTRTPTPAPATPTPTTAAGGECCFSWSGTVFVDTNYNGMKDAGEVGYPNVGIDMREYDTNAFLGTPRTDTQGNYNFNNRLTSGIKYKASIKVDELNGYLTTSPIDIVQIVTGNMTNQNFGVVPITSKTGTCSIVHAAWQRTPASEGQTALLRVIVQGDCSGKKVHFTVRENDSILEGGFDEDATSQPIDTFIDTNDNVAYTSWFVERQNDCGGLCNPPEYFFNANIVGDSTTVRSQNPLLVVSPGISYPTHQQYSGVGVPRTEAGYGQDVETWWATHPFNPDNPTYIPASSIGSPNPQVNVKTQFGGNIQAAVDSLPQAGGTLIFDPGTYQLNYRLIGRSNVHFIAPTGGVTIAGGTLSDDDSINNYNGSIVGCQEALDYGAFDTAVSSGNNPSHAAAFECVNNRRGGIYFKNIIFDGEGTSISSMRFAAIRDVLFDNVTFRNFATSPLHNGTINGHAMLDGIWFRNSTLDGATYALYLDGCHNCGIVNSTIRNNGGPLYLTNHDFMQDYNDNGFIDEWEARSGRYIVIQGNTFPTGGNVINATATKVLVTKNTHLSGGGVAFDVGTIPEWPYYFNKVIGNVFQRPISSMVDFGNSTGCNSYPYCFGGKYTVRDNIAKDDNFMNTLVAENGTVEGPNTVTNNCVAGTLWGTSTPCNVDATPSPATPTPTTPPGQPTPTPIPCAINTASWSTSSATQGQPVSLIVTTTGPCVGKQVAFTVRENDSFAEGLVDEDAQLQPLNATINNNTATGTWLAEWQNDCEGRCLPPEYFFNASIVGQGGSFRSADPLLEVTQLLPPPVPTPTLAPTNTPFPTVTPTRTPTPVPPTPTRTPTPSPTIIAVTNTPTTKPPTATPTGTGTGTACQFTSASWGTTGIVAEGTILTLRVTGNDACNGKKVGFRVREEDTLLDEDARVQPGPIIMSGGQGATTQGTTRWVAEWQNDCFFGLCNPPEYFFNAFVADAPGITIRSNDPLVKVTKTISALHFSLRIEGISTTTESLAKIVIRATDGTSETLTDFPLIQESGDNFTGYIGSTFPPGDYSLFIAIPGHLRKKFSVQTEDIVTAPTTLSTEPVLAGDIVLDNVINALDIGKLQEDYSPLNPTISAADLNGDGFVNAPDAKFVLDNYLKKGD